MTTQEIPTIKLRPGQGKRVRYGYPWIYSNEIEMNPAVKAFSRGTFVRFTEADGSVLGQGFFNAHVLISGRLLTRAEAPLNIGDFLKHKLENALKLRQSIFAQRYFRWVHAEADGLPGLIIDLFDQTVVVQINVAGFELLKNELIEAIQSLVSPQSILLKCDTAARTMEGLEHYDQVIGVDAPSPLPLIESSLKFFADPAGGQKTGWFFDQRDNRAAVAKLAKDRSVVDIYSYAGGFGISAAVAEAKSVKLVDRSEPALTLAKLAAEANGVADKVSFQKAEAFDFLQQTITQKATYDLVCCDPPAFIKSKKDVPTGLKGYRKLIRMAAEIVAPGGFLFIASCSHNLTLESFDEEFSRGIGQAKRTGRILRKGGAGMDHPVHPLLPETAYLKSILAQLD